MKSFSRIITLCFCAFSPLVGGKSRLEEKLGAVIQAPRFSAPPKTSLLKETIIAITTPILKNRIEELNYDRIFPVLQFLDHFEKTREEFHSITPLEAFTSFQYDLSGKKNRGGACLALTMDLHRAILPLFQPYITLATVPPKYQQFAFPYFVHSAVLIQYENPTDAGFILFDPSFDIDIPIVLSKTGESVYFETKAKGTWRFYLENDHIICDTTPGIPNNLIVYSTLQIENPIESSGNPMILADRKLALLSRAADGTHKAHLSLEFNKRCCNWTYYGERRPQIPFYQLLQKDLFPENFLRDLSFTEEELQARFAKILEHENTLNQLYSEYLNLLKQSEDDNLLKIIYAP